MYIDAHKQFRMEDLAMKKLMLLSLVVGVALLGTQAFASPPIAPPVEGFIIHSFTEVVVDPGPDGTNSFSESESFNWTYYEGWGSGPFYPNGYVPAPAHWSTSWDYCNTVACNPTVTSGLVSELGFTEGAEIAYEQTFESRSGHTEFTKTFDAKSDPDPGDDNLVVKKNIEYEALDPAVDFAKHEEKVGLSVISMGANSSTIATEAAGLLTLCPWAAEGGSSVTGGGYPPTNEAIAAGSSFNVTRIVGFESESHVNSSINPALSYDVTANEGDGEISAAFIVELWEGPAGYVWAPIPIWRNDGTAAEPNWVNNDVCVEGYQCHCDQRAIIQNGYNEYAVWQLPRDAYGPPPLASKTVYSESATATGTWSFTKNVSYESTMPTMGTPTGQFPFNRILE
jgi:hypothetical protein